MIIRSWPVTFNRDIMGGPVRHRIDPRFYPGAKLPKAGRRPGGYAGVPAPIRPGRWVSMPPSLPGGSYGSYDRWMRNAKFFNRFLTGSSLAAPMIEVGKTAAAYSRWLDGIEYSPGFSAGWTATCDIRVGMPLYGPFAGGPACGGGYFAPGKHWYDPWSDVLGIYGLQPGPLYYPFGSPPGWYQHQISQGVPSPLASPEIYTIRLVGRNTAFGPGSAPAPMVQLIPDDRWPAEYWPQLAPVVPGTVPAVIPASVMAGAQPGLMPRPAGTPGPGPGVTPDPEPDPDRPGPGDKTPPFFPPRGKPERGERERKRKKRAGKGAARAAAAILSGVGIATEVFDAVDAAWWAMSNQSRRDAFKYFGGPPTPAERAWWIANHPDAVDWDKFLANWAAQQAGDKAAAMGRKSNREWHRRNPFDMTGKSPQQMANRLWHLINQSLEGMI